MDSKEQTAKIEQARLNVPVEIRTDPYLTLHHELATGKDSQGNETEILVDIGFRAIYLEVTGITYVYKVSDLLHEMMQQHEARLTSVTPPATKRFGTLPPDFPKLYDLLGLGITTLEELEARSFTEIYNAVGYMSVDNVGSAMKALQASRDA